MSGMCGIAGRSAATTTAPIASMLHALRHRGPDALGLYVGPDGDVALGYVHLGAFEAKPASARVGFTSGPDFSAAIDGCISNRFEVGRDVGIPGQPASDAELALLSYRAHGDACLARLDGPFSLAIWDRQARRLTLSRDKLGEKSLYYYYDQTQRTLVFASEVKAILLYPPVRAELDLDSLSIYLAFGYIPGPRTLFKNIYKLLPGERLQFDLAAPPVRKKYWHLPPLSDAVADEADCVRRLRDLFLQGLEAYVSGCPDVAVFLSGGVDSSIIVAGLRALGVPNVQTFTVGFDFGPSTAHLRQDLEYARLVANRFGTTHHEVLIDASHDAGPGLLRVIGQLDDLIMTPTVYSKYLLADAVRQAGLKSILTGSAAAGACGVHRKYLNHHKRTRVEARIRGCQTDEARYYRLRGGLFDLGVQKRLLKREPQIGTEDILNVLHEYIGDIRSQDFFRLFLFSNLMITSTEKTLRVLDRSGSLASVEIRSPYLDRALVEYSTQIPASFDRGETYVSLKTHLKKAFESELPSAVLDRSVVGYPRCYWTNSDSVRAYQQQVLNRDVIEGNGILNWDGVAQILEEEQQSDALSAGKHTWALTQFCLWYEIYVNQNPAFVRGSESFDRGQPAPMPSLSRLP